MLLVESQVLDQQLYYICIIYRLDIVVGKIRIIEEIIMVKKIMLQLINEQINKFMQKD